MIALVTGPVRSGKSTHAAWVAHDLGVPVTYVATARFDLTDPEMADRVARHRAARGPEVALVELWQPGVPDLPALVASAAHDTTLLIDSLGTWIAGHLLDLETLADRDGAQALAQLERATAALIPALRAARAHIVIVSEQTGWGLVPPTPLGRIFRDHIGVMEQSIAKIADAAHLVVAGFALDIKKLGLPVRS